MNKQIELKRLELKKQTALAAKARIELDMLEKQVELSRLEQQLQQQELEIKLANDKIEELKGE